MSNFYSVIRELFNQKACFECGPMFYNDKIFIVDSTPGPIYHFDGEGNLVDTQQPVPCKEKPRKGFKP